MNCELTKSVKNDHMLFSSLPATAVTRGWNGYRNKSQHRRSTLEKKIIPPLLQGFEPATFQSRVRRSNHSAIPGPEGQSHKTESTNHTTTFPKRKDSRIGIEQTSSCLPAQRLTARPNRLTGIDLERSGFSNTASIDFDQSFVFIKQFRQPTHPCSTAWDLKGSLLIRQYSLFTPVLSEFVLS